MNRRFCLLVLILTSLLLTSCARSSKKDNGAGKAGEVVFNDGIKTTAGNEIVLDDGDLKNDAENSMSGSASAQMTKIAADGSQINTTFDRYGNKTEMRNFNYDSRLKFVMIRTAADGQKQVFVYGQNGEVKTLPENMLDKVLTAPADEIAGAVGIFQQQIQTAKPTIVQNNQPPLQPLPSYKFPIQTPPLETAAPTLEQSAETEKAQPAAAPGGETPADKTKLKTESPTPNNQPNEKN